MNPSLKRTNELHLAGLNVLAGLSSAKRSKLAFRVGEMSLPKSLGFLTMASIAGASVGSFLAGTSRPSRAVAWGGASMIAGITMSELGTHSEMPVQKDPLLFVGVGLAAAGISSTAVSLARMFAAWATPTAT